MPPQPLTCLSDSEIAAALAALPGWTRRADPDAFEKEFRFKDFRAAFAFMTQVADLAEAADHHPDWSNVYNRVRIRLSTHDSGGITQKDVDLARAIEAIS